MVVSDELHQNIRHEALFVIFATEVKNRDRQYMLKDWFERLGDEYERLSEERDGEGCN